MTTYQDLHWDSLNFVKTHLYRQVATPLDHALGRLAIADHVGRGELSLEQFQHTAYSVEIALNLLRAWAALIHVKSGGTIRPDQRHTLAAGAWPGWLVDRLKTQTTVQIDYTRPLTVHPETFYHSLLLLCDVCAAIGTLKQLVVANANHGQIGVWVRAVFSPPPTGAYKGLGDIVKHLESGASDHDMAVQLHVAVSLLEINGASLKVQNNTETGDQALAALLPVQQAVADHAEKSTGSLYAHLARELGEPSPAQEPVQDQGALSESDEPSSAGKPRLTRPVLAPTPEAPGLLLAALHGALPDDESDVENKPETRIVPPPDRDEHLAAALDDADPTAPEPESPEPGGVENKPETDASADTPETESAPDDAPTAVSPGASPGAADADVIEVVTVENAPDTLIVPPPDFRRRLITLRPVSQAGADTDQSDQSDAETDHTTPDSPPEQPAHQDS